jgi:hypothetical protein
MGEGFMHTSEGMVMFGGAFIITSIVAWMLGMVESKLMVSAPSGAIA